MLARARASLTDGPHLDMQLNALAPLWLALLALPSPCAPQNPRAWQHSGSITILTTPEGADLPAGAAVEGFPLLVRLHSDFFDFGAARPEGEDLRFFDSGGRALPHEIEEWDAAHGSASVWVRVPRIEGNSRQQLRMDWGNASAEARSSGAAVFDAANGHASVWHMGGQVTDAVGSVESKDEGTTPTRGVIGGARHLAGSQGIHAGDLISSYPSGLGPMSTEAWFRAERPNATVVAWGKEQRPGKVMLNFLSPPRVAIQCYFADVEAQRPLALGEWVHVVHTYQDRDSRVYINGALDGASTPVLDIPEVTSLWIGGWYGNYQFVGDIDEVRISNVVRSPEWVRLQYENQKPLQTLVGPVVQPGDVLSVSARELTVAEGERVALRASAGGAQKLYWSLLRDGRATLLATDRFNFEFEAGRVTEDEHVTLRLEAVYPDEVRTQDIAVTILERVPEPEFTLQAPEQWDGRSPITIAPLLATNDLDPKHTSTEAAWPLTWQWDVSGIACITEVTPGGLVLERAQNSGTLTVTATANNGGAPRSSAVTIVVSEPMLDAWVQRAPDDDERPQDGQFYARDDEGLGTLHCNGTLAQAADELRLRLFADGELIETFVQRPTGAGGYAFTVRLRAGLTQYTVELVSLLDGAETIVHRAEDLVCGDAFIINGQSNALATDTGEESPRETNRWIRSYADPRFRHADERRHADRGPQNLWCLPVWKAGDQELAELGWWGMELAKGLVERQGVPIFIVNGAVGGTRIDQHQRNPRDPEDLDTIYGRLLWRVRQARLTHGIRAILWHQGESDQGADGPDGGYGWQTYERYFVALSAGWKRDFPNVQHYYVFQIWPNSCSMGNGHGDMLREVQRSLPRLYSKLDVLSTLGIEPEGPCHFPLVGWSAFARSVQPLIERDLYGRALAEPMTAPNVLRVSYASPAMDELRLEFDQPVVWHDGLVSEFYLDGARDQVAAGSAAGNVLTLTLKAPSAARRITYLEELSWSQRRLLRGRTGIAALTFCDVPIADGPAR